MDKSESSKEKEKKIIKKNWFSIRRIMFLSFLIFLLSIIILKLKFHFNIFISLIISLIIIVLVIYIFIRLFLRRLKKAGNSEDWHDLYGSKISNIPYFKNDIILNSFKKNGDNFNEEIGEVNNGKDYQKNERNYYDLFIPYSSLKRKNKYNGIILFIHGGAWRYGKKEHIGFLCSRYAKFGFITAAMNHTYLNKKYEGYSIFRIMDEINSCIQNIKDYLKNEGFDENKLELAIGGISSGAHLSSLFGYSIKKCPIPIKFVINFVGPLSLDSEYWYKIKNDDEVLENIEPKDIEDAIKEKKIVKTFDNELSVVKLMNAFIGGKYTDKEINDMIENKTIKTNNEKYKEMLKIAKYTFPVTFINNNTAPTLCEYGGKDTLVGIAQYKFLKQLSEKHGNRVVLIYMKYGGHMLDSYDTENGMNAIREMHYQILNFAKTYFTSEKEENSLFTI